MLQVLQDDRSLFRVSVHSFFRARSLYRVSLPRVEHCHDFLLEVSLDPVRSWTRVYRLKSFVVYFVRGVNSRQGVIPNGRSFSAERPFLRGSDWQKKFPRSELVLDGPNKTNLAVDDEQGDVPVNPLELVCSN